MNMILTTTIFTNSSPEVHGEGVSAYSAKLHDHIAGVCLHLKVLH